MIIRVTPLGHAIFYAKDSYKKFHGGRDGPEDGLASETLDLPTGGTATGYKA